MRQPRVIVIRHGETEWSINGRHTGTSDIPLTAKGEEQVARLSKTAVGPDGFLRPERIARIFVSPRVRARRTLELLLSSVPQPQRDLLADRTTIDDAVQEWMYGEGEGLRPAELSQRYGSQWQKYRDGFPGGETPEAIRTRIQGVISNVHAVHARYWEANDESEPSDVLIVSHGDFTRCFLIAWLDLPFEAGQNLTVSPGAINVGGYRPNSISKRTLEGFNLYSLPPS
ncbi:hypothetical protein E5Q_06752 [Mixia osmundae IAM 14324]|uniref:Phosphoglycerate mutase n=1 Tax=Mixia osmundae (strain CBS 9802 / IAM 14324 / JCM 22182 / KY 12970) TaxID=764103 RepID=G7EB39_MIXOS|nr:hypothetical protein E5Q_06752 [Mixia osmundae IAM 14324]